MCFKLKFNILNKFLTFIHRHNLKTNFDKIIGIAKSALSDILLEENNFVVYKSKPKITDIEIIDLAFTAESLGIDSENLHFQSLEMNFV